MTQQGRMRFLQLRQVKFTLIINHISISTNTYGNARLPFVNRLIIITSEQDYT